MTLSDMLPSFADIISSSVILGVGTAAAYFFRDQLAQWFIARLKFSYDTKLEQFRGELAEKSRRIEHLRSGPLGVRAQRRGHVDRRRLEAIDQLWAAVKTLQPLRSNCVTMSIVRWPEAAEGTRDDPRAREMFAAISANLPDQLPNHEAHASRLYVSPLAWALFNAYQTTLAYSYMQMMTLRTGVGPKYSGEFDSLARMLVVALPDWEERITGLGQAALPDVASELENRLLQELQRNLEGRDDDRTEIKQAAEIIKLATQLGIDYSKENVADNAKSDFIVRTASTA